MLVRRRSRPVRSGAVAVELAILLPLLMFMAVIGVDYARVFSRTLILETASRNAAVYACQDFEKAADTAGIQAVAQKDLWELRDVSPTVTSVVTTGADGFQYVKVTVTMTFTTVTDFPGVPRTSTLTRSTEFRVNPTTPKPGTY